MKTMGYDGYMPPEIAPPPAPAPEPHHIKPVPIIIAVLVLILAGIALWFVLTRPSPVIGPPGEATSTPQTATSVKQHITDKGQYYQIDAAYASATPLEWSASPAAEAKAVASMKKFETDQIAQFKEDSGLNHLTAEDIQTQGLSKDRYYALTIDYKIYSSTVSISYVYLIYADTLGAHPNTYYRTFTFDAATGTELAVKDLFTPSTDYLAVLSNQARTKLPAQMKAASGYDPDMDMLDAGTSADAANFQDFYLDGSDLVIIFPPYQVAAYAFGTIELRIPRASLGNALKAEFR